MNHKAFTILELLVVISVLVILIGIAIPRFKGMQDSANITKVKSELKTIQSALESYCTFSQNTKCDFTMGGIYDSSSTIVDMQSSYLISASPKMLPNYLYDPFSPSGALEYLVWTNGKCYVIYSLGPNADYASFDASVEIDPNYNGTTGAFTPPATYPNMIYVTNNSKC